MNEKESLNLTIEEVKVIAIKEIPDGYRLLDEQEYLQDKDLVYVGKYGSDEVCFREPYKISKNQRALNYYCAIRPI